jgi:hypothetical protein
MARDIRSLEDMALDRELEALLAVEPSPGFDTRVRAHVARAGAMTPAWSPAWRWWLVPAGCLVAASVAFVLTRPVQAPPAMATVLPGWSIAVSPASRPPVVTSEVVGAPTRERAPGTRVRVDELRAHQPEPVILISPREAEAIRSLLARSEPLHIRLVSVGLFEPLLATRAVEPLSVDPIVIDPVRMTRDFSEGVWP